jgi:glucose-1-phosphate thymidylyltransferase
MGDKPLINFLMDKIQALPGLSEVIVVTNDKFCDVFKEWAGKQKNYPAGIRIVSDGTKAPEERLGSIGDIDFILKKGNVDDDLLVLGGDNLFDYSLNDYLSFAKSKSPAVTVGLYDIGSKREAKQFGVAAVDAGKKIVSFEEKPPAPKSSLIAMCLYYFPKVSQHGIADYIRESKKTDKAGEYIRWLSRKQNVYGYTFVGKWYDIGSIESYEAAKNDFLKK